MKQTVRQGILRQIYPKQYQTEEPKLDPVKVKKLLHSLAAPVPALKPDWERTVERSYRNPEKRIPGVKASRGRVIPHLGAQKVQSCPPLKVTSGMDTTRSMDPTAGMDPAVRKIYEEEAAMNGMAISQYLATLGKVMTPNVEHRFNPGDRAFTYKYGEPLVRSENFFDLTTNMRRVHRWYMENTKKGLAAISVGVKDEHYFRGEDVINVEFPELFQLYNQDALDKSLLSCYCL